MQPAPSRKNNLNGKSRRRSAFTIIELLVVISIIALLISILLPALSKARDTAQGIQCGSNIRQAFLALTLYADDYNNRYPMLTTKLPNGSNVLTDRAWFTALYVNQSYLRHDVFKKFSNNTLALVSHALNCPKETSYQGYSLDQTNAAYEASNFGLNWEIYRVAIPAFYGLSPGMRFDTPLPRDAIRRPDRVYFLADTGSETWSYYMREVTPPTAGYVDFRHQSAASVLWFDGHVTQERSVNPNPTVVAWRDGY